MLIKECYQKSIYLNLTVLNSPKFPTLGEYRAEVFLLLRKSAAIAALFQIQIVVVLA